MELAPLEIVFLVVPCAVLAFALVGNRPRVDRYAAVNHLTFDDESRERVRSALRRTSRGRIGGAATGGLVACGLVAWSSWRANWVAALAAVLLGTLVGIAVASSPRAGIPGTRRSASLIARRVDDYRPRRAALALRAVLLVTIALGAVVVSVAAVEVAVTACIVAGSVALSAFAWWSGTIVERRIVEGARDRTDADLRRVDDALRSTSVRAVHHSVLGVMLCSLALVGTVAVTSQTFDGVRLGGTNVFVTPAGATNVSTENLTPLGSPVAVVRIRWTDAGGRSHELVRRTRGDATITMGDLWANQWIIAIGFWAGLLGFLGGLYEWGRASKAWRRPSRTPEPVPVGSNA